MFFEIFSGKPSTTRLVTTFCRNDKFTYCDDLYVIHVGLSSLFQFIACQYHLVALAALCAERQCAVAISQVAALTVLRFHYNLGGAALFPGDVYVEASLGAYTLNFALAPGIG